MSDKRVVEFVKATRLNLGKIGQFHVNEGDRIEADAQVANIQGTEVPSSVVNFIFREGYRLVRFVEGVPIPKVKAGPKRPVPTRSEVGDLPIVPPDTAEETGLQIDDSKGANLVKGKPTANFSKPSGEVSGDSSDGVVMDPNPEAKTKGEVSDGDSAQESRLFDGDGVSSDELAAVKDSLKAVEGYEDKSRRSRASMIKKHTNKVVLEKMLAKEPDKDLKARIEKKLK